CPPVSTPCPYTSLFRSGCVRLGVAVVAGHGQGVGGQLRLVQQPGQVVAALAAGSLLYGGNHGVRLCSAAGGQHGHERCQSGVPRSEEHTSELQSRENLV